MARAPVPRSLAVTGECQNCSQTECALPRCCEPHGQPKPVATGHEIKNPTSPLCFLQVTENLNAGKGYFAAEAILSRINGGALPEYAYAFKVDVGCAWRLWTKHKQLSALAWSHSVPCVHAGRFIRGWPHGMRMHCLWS